MEKESFETLLNNLNREDREKFDYILQFYTKEHVYYNFEFFKHALKDFKTFQYKKFTKPVDEKVKKLIDKIDLESILDVIEDIKLSFIGNNENKSVNDLLLYLTTFAEVSDKTREKIISSSPKYKRIVENGVLNPEEILSAIEKAFQRAMEFGDRLDLKNIENLINFACSEKIDKLTTDISKDLYDDSSQESKILAISEDLSKKLDRKSIEEAYEKDGNVVSRNKSILAVKVILGDDFEKVDDILIERLKAMLRTFDLTKMTDEDINLFRDNLKDIIEKGMDIEDIFFIKNISSNEDALIAYSNLPENLQRQVVSLNVIAKKTEIANILDALAFIKEEKRKEKEYQTEVGLDERITFGVELELDGIRPEVLKEFISKNELYKNLKLQYGLKSGFYNWGIDSDGTVPNGVELISFVMKDKPKDWESLKEVCTAMDALNSFAGKTCGGHIHIGANILGTDEEAWKNLFKIWKVAEPIIYKVSNKENEEFREGTFKEASPVANIIDDILKKGLVKINSYEDLKKLATEFTKRSIVDVSWSGRTKAMNLQCIAEGKQDTIEFRIPNSSLDPIELQSTIKFFAKLVEVSKKMSEDKEYKNNEFNALMTSQTEENRMKALMNLVFDDDEDKNVFYRRYYSRPKELNVNGLAYSDVLKKDVAINENARYEWRGRR